jgi:hypothetical protein
MHTKLQFIAKVTQINHNKINQLPIIVYKNANNACKVTRFALSFKYTQTSKCVKYVRI